jgi:carboxyl-terminal processing protease
MGIIKLNQFTGNTTELLDQAIAQSQKDNVKGIVLDMRNNPGGLLDVAVEVTSRFMNSGTVVIERDKDKKETELKTVGTKVKVTVPVILLVNQGSASASEIVAGALQDVNRAKVLGETTFGKGSVQSVERLKDGSAIRITIAEWLTPKKREINKQGIKPDIEVKLSEDDVKNKRDPQLDKALELLKAGG